jgi:uncharacterized membrane protein YqhA
MYYHNGSVHVEKEDQCMTCKNFAEGVACPLLQALGMGLVSLEGTLYVTNCGFYEEFVRKLRLVPKSDKKESKE